MNVPQNIREIKFRYVCKDVNGTIFYVFKTLVEIETISYIGAHNDFLSAEIIISRDQFTGIKDKNGKEIYEGDVVIGEGGAEYQGMREYGDTVIVDMSSQRFHEIIDLFQHMDDIEIIGNIHENPEMLK